MRQLLNTLFVLSEDAYLSVNGENVVISREQKEVARFPLHTLEGILCFSYAGASPALMGACVQRGVDIAFFSPRGQFLARTVGEERGNVLLRQTQNRVSDDPYQSCRYARGFILGKVYNARWVLERATRDHPQRVPVEALKTAAAQMAQSLPLIASCEDPAQLLGLEGEAAKLYFGVFNHLILQQKGISVLPRAAADHRSITSTPCFHSPIHSSRATVPPRLKVPGSTRTSASCTAQDPVAAVSHSTSWRSCAPCMPTALCSPA